MILAQALSIAEKLVDLLSPGCTRIEIAGGVRRQKADCHDIEIVSIPDQRPAHLVFGQPAYKTVLDAIIASAEYPDETGLRLHKIMGGDKYKKLGVSLDGGHTWCISLDLFLVTPPAQWGLLYLIRTGPAEFSHWIVTPKFKSGALPNGLQVHDAAIWNGETKLNTPEEIDVLRLCGLDWIEPKNRSPRWVRPVRQVAIQNI
jgi:DNA polymerase/3'-5' exonuclease PolX